MIDYVTGIWQQLNLSTFWIAFGATMLLVAALAHRLLKGPTAAAPTSTTTVIPETPVGTAAGVVQRQLEDELPVSRWRKYASVKGILGVIALLLVAYFIYPRDQGLTLKGDATITNVDVGFLSAVALAIALLVFLAVWLFKGKPSKLAGLIGTGVVLFILGFMLFHWAFAEEAPDVAKVWRKGFTSWAKGESKPAVSREIPQATEASLRWDVRKEDGTIPKGVWSLPYVAPGGYDSDFPPGHGTIYEAEYWDVKKKDWIPHRFGSRPDTNKFRMRFIVEGETRLAFSLRRF